MGPVPRTAGDMLLADELRDVHHTDLWRLVDMEQPGNECEILLLCENLPDALERIRAAPYTLNADCILVLGGPANPVGALHIPMLQMLRAARTAGIAISGAAVRANGERRLGQFLSATVRELSHDCTLDEAITTASREGSVGAPRLLFSRQLATRTSIALTAARLGAQLAPTASVPVQIRPSPPPIVSADIESTLANAKPEIYPHPRSYRSSITQTSIRQLESGEAPTPVGAEYSQLPEGASIKISEIHRRLGYLASDGVWQYESGDARIYVATRDELAESTGISTRLAPVGANIPPQATADIDTRQVHIQLFENGSDKPSPCLHSDADYRLQVYIKTPDGEGRASGKPFPTSELPENETGYELDVSFIPLSTTETGYFAAPQQAQIFLPNVGKSTAAEFTFKTHGLASTLESRIIISYENRVLQSLRFDGHLCKYDDKKPKEYRFEVENVVSPGFHNLAHAQSFDAAIVIDGDPNSPALSTISGNVVSIFSPKGLDVSLKVLQDTLTDETAVQRTANSFASEDLKDLVWTLMNHGRMIHNLLEQQVGPEILKAGRIQLVEAQPGAYFPLEFVYPLNLPRKPPPMCEHAADALSGKSSHFDCPNKDDPAHMCPMRFWGFHKHIERHPAVKPRSTNPVGSNLPPSLIGKLKLFENAQVARSNRVQPPDFDLPEGLLKVIKESFIGMETPSGWDAWVDAIEKGSPGFLLLLAHSDESARLPALEINQELLPLASVEKEYVKGPIAIAPVVFLFSCSAKDPKMGFLTFVDQFKRSQASLIIGTLSTISAQRASRFLAGALSVLKRAENSGRTFGDVFLELKRKSLATGDGFALNLVAYGDMSWQI
jgi:hypothetical protein